MQRWPRRRLRDQRQGGVADHAETACRWRLPGGRLLALTCGNRDAPPDCAVRAATSATTETSDATPQARMRRRVPDVRLLVADCRLRAGEASRASGKPRADCTCTSPTVLDLTHVPPRRTAKGAPTSVSVSVITVSDTRTMETDASGRAIAELLEHAGHRVHGRGDLKDEPAQVEARPCAGRR